MKPSDQGSLMGGQGESAPPTRAASQNYLQKTYFGSNFASPEGPGGGNTAGHLITALHFPPTLGGKTEHFHCLQRRELQGLAEARVQSLAVECLIITSFADGNISM